MMNNKYGHIQSFGDFENEKMKLYYQIKYSEKKLELKYIEIMLLLSPAKLIPLFVSEWLSPMMSFIKSFFGHFTHHKGNAEKEEKIN